MKDRLASLREDLPASIVVFLVALPLCLGIAHASGVPPLAGVISGIVGGIIIGFLSGSHTSVSGPAAGLIVMVLAALEEFGYPGLLLVTMMAGLMQVSFGLMKLGWIQRLFPKTVIQGMLVAIGLILILKQIPHAIGFEGDFEGSEAFLQADGRNTFSEIPFAIGHFHPGALIIALVSLVILVGAPKVEFIKKRTWLPAALLAVVAGVLVNAVIGFTAPDIIVAGEHLVTLPTGGFSDIQAELATPQWSLLLDEPAVWLSAFGIAIVASVETLLCTEAVDSLDPQKRRTDANRELLAQGVGNAIAGCLGGIPITAVIVRGSANVHAGAKTKASAIMHGAFLLVSILVAASVLNLIPLSALAALLIVIGFRLASPKKIYAILKRSPAHWVPFVTTVSVIMFTDLLKGIFVGLAVSTLFVIISALRAKSKAKAGQKVTLEVGPIVPWLSQKMVGSVASTANGTGLTIDASDSDPLDASMRESLAKMQKDAEVRGVVVELRGHLPEDPKDEDADGDHDDAQSTVDEKVA